MKKNDLGIIFFVVCTVLIFFLAEGNAQTYPAAAYTEEELKQVRRWEAQWAGKRITSSTVESVKEFLPGSFYDLMKNTDRYGESWFEIVPYRQILPSQGLIRFTRKHAGEPRIGENTELVNWTAGVPFPGTMDPLEIAHNFRRRNYGDSSTTEERGFLTDGRLKYDRRLYIKNNHLFFSGRTDVPPVPELKDNPKQIWRAFHMEQLEPPEARNMRIFELHYKDALKAYDSWYWMSTVRRIRRRSTAERQDAVGGADFCGFDNFGWDGPVEINRYKHLGMKEYLLVRHSDSEKLTHTPGKVLFDGTTRERIKVHVIEAVNEDPNFLYSRMIWYVDPETWQILYSDRYDRQGRLWKVLDQLGFVTTGYQGQPVDYFNASQMIDVRRQHATKATAAYQFGVDIDTRMFTLHYLQRHGY